MKLSGLVISVIFTFWAGWAASKPIPVSSGEHGQFSRLVFEGRSLQGWEHVRTGKENVITFPNQKEGFRTDSIYNFIRKDRLRSFTANASKFQFEISCVCTVEVFEIGETILVVDIKGDAGSIDDDRIYLAEKFEIEREDVSFNFGAKISKSENGNSQEKFDFSIRPKEIADFSDSKAPIIDLSGFEGARNQIPLIDNDSSLGSIQNQLLLEIGSAASRGVLNRSQNFSSHVEVRRPQVDVSIFDSSNFIEPYVERNDIEQIRITSSSDRKSASNFPSKSTPAGLVCIDPVRVDVSSWNDGRSFEQQIGDYRSELFGEFDELDSENAIQLVRLYIHFGFGAEALGVLNMLASGQEEWPELFELAKILEYGYAPNGRFLRMYVDCDSPASLWGIISVKMIPSEQTVNVKAALRSLNALPMHLRKFLSAELSLRLLEYGDKEGAKNAMRSLNRASDSPNISIALAQVEIDISDGNLNGANSSLQDVVNSNSEFSARALNSLIQRKVEEGLPISFDTIHLVESYIQELKDTPMETELKRSQILTFAKTNQFERAFFALSELPTTKENKYLPSTILELLVSDSSDIVFLTQIFSNVIESSFSFGGEQLFLAALRLQELGFYEVSEQVLRNEQIKLETREFKMLSAKISLNLDRPAAAEAILLNLSGSDVALMRAQIEEKKQDRVLAYEMYKNIERKSAAENNAWLSDEWKTIADPKNAIFGPLVSVANTIFDPSNELSGMLNRTQTLLDESSKSRHSIELVLERSEWN